MCSALGDIAVGSSHATQTKAGRILDLYDRVWQGRPLSAREFVISADEKSSIQARRRKQPRLSPAPGRSTRVEHEYFREGAWTYLAAWAGEDQLGPPSPCSSGRFEPDAGATADHADGLPEELRFALDGRNGGCGAHDSSGQQF